MKQNRRRRVGFVLFPIRLLGMHNYLRNLFAALRSLPDQPITPVLFAGTKQADLSTEFLGVEVVRSRMLDRGSPAWLARQSLLRITGRDLLLSKLLSSHRIDVLSHSGGLGRKATLKTIGWIADLQHTHLPRLFSTKELHARDTQFRQLCATCDRIIVGSNFGLADLAAFAPQQAHKGVVLRFIASPALLSRATSLPVLETTYGFSGPYFLLPNQFWPHKNHSLAIEALHTAKRCGDTFQILMTGSSQGGPDPDLFRSLLRRAEELGVLAQFRVLGVVPFDDLVGLMQHTVAFINPSRFEGWSTSVEEAKTMGKPILLSDIPVHREQAPAQGYYFATDAPTALADAMRLVMRKHSENVDQQMQRDALNDYPERLRAYGEAYRTIVETTLQGCTADLRAE